MTSTNVTNDVFNSPDALTNIAPAIPTIDTYTGTVAELVGEGKKYKTLEALAASVIHKDEFIETLKKEKSDVLDKLQKVVKTDEVFDKLVNQSNEVKTIPSTDDITKLIEETVNKNKVREIEYANIKIANDKLVEHFGSLEKAKEFIENKSRQLSLSKEFLMSAAAKNPLAFYNVMELNFNRDSGNNGIMTGSINTESKDSTNANKAGTKAYFDALYKADKKRYFTPEVQKQIQEAGFKGTYFS